VLVRTGGRYPGARGGGDRSWLLIKHKDEWAGDVDIAEFAPKSVKSQGDFEDILAQDTPAVWLTNRPAKGGETGAMLADIIERAARLKRSRLAASRDPGATDTKERTHAAKGAPPKTARKTPSSASARKTPSSAKKK
jgi:hypothetical protein